MNATALDGSQWIDASALERDTRAASQPFPFLIRPRILPDTLKQRLHDDFPAIKGAGYLPYEPGQCGPAINSLIDQLVARDFADALGSALGVDRLSQYPVYVSICARLNRRHGTIHTDGKSKVASVLLYLNDNWSPQRGGCLRFLHRIDDIEDTIVPEIPPEYGTLVAFRRTDNSFHGHLPFEGERRVIQIAWLVSADDKLRKAKRGRLANGIKKLLGWLDTKIGKGRDDNAFKR